ncbi:MAG: DegT/DnrJ/EryC1/StrS family aminotransferase [Thermoguttaceae bacterium]|jgi:dTDP-4-amino-4,6-dideoxygalactose transaminase|nr:DegT/DnrJ/EryC1/StrS family aminotransferase [Thermoguttaceae bacterium]
MKDKVTRRGFIQTAAAGSAAMAALNAGRGPTVFAADADKPALLGGTRVHQGSWPRWPQWDESWEADILEVLRSGRWCGHGGSGKVGDFETAYANILGAKRCVTMASGTTSLITALHVMGVDAGDEVITSPYTFVATYNTILMHKALPVFADTDPATLTMDPASIERCITERTRAILPVHIYGMPCDMDPINAIAKKHNLAVVEDACQAWLAEYKGKKCGTLGDLGCFSFQNSKHIPAGDSGAITSNNEELADRCQSFHNVGRSSGAFKGSGYFTLGSNFRMNHYQAAMLLPQIDKLVRETEVRRQNGDYLTAGLKEIPGIEPVRLPGNSRAVWHLYPFRYNASQFNGLPRDRFMQALRAEGIPCSGGYSEQYFDGALDEVINSRGFQRLFPAERLKAYRESFAELKGNKQVCETTVGIFNTLLLADRSDVDHIVEAVRKIQAHSAALVA